MLAFRLPCVLVCVFSFSPLWWQTPSACWLDVTAHAVRADVYEHVIVLPADGTVLPDILQE